MSPKEYQEFTKSVAMYPREIALEYVALQLAAEAGEVAGKVAKLYRDNTDFDTFLYDAKRELGDVLWYVSQMCNELGFTMEDVMETNRDKLLSRKERGVLSGSGDNR